MNEVFKEGLKILNKLQETQGDKLELAGRIIGKSFMEGHKFFVTGSGHSHTMAEEFYARAGGYAKILVELYNASKGDVVLITSNSGRNAYPIEMALEAKSKGAYVIAVTSKNHSDSVTSRHKSGKKLIDIADLVIDNCGVVGDCILQVPGLHEKMCPTSSMANAFIAQSINVACAKYLIENNCEVPVFASLNCDGNEDHNEAYFNKYTRMY